MGTTQPRVQRAPHFFTEAKAAEEWRKPISSIYSRGHEYL
jgi:hypothetical protein